MADTVSAVSGRAVTAPSVLADYAQESTIGDPTANELDKDAFLQLLVAQLRYQDPLNPSSPEDFMATTAQFTTIEKLDELTTQGENDAIVSGLSMASSLVGRTIDYLGPGDIPTSGVVESARVVGGGVVLNTSTGPVDLAAVIGIGATVPPAPPAADPTDAADPTGAADPTDATSAAPSEPADPTAVETGPTESEPTEPTATETEGTPS